jgi:hypothetical protein
MLRAMALLPSHSVVSTEATGLEMVLGSLETRSGWRQSLQGRDSNERMVSCNEKYLSSGTDV